MDLQLLPSGHCTILAWILNKVQRVRIHVAWNWEELCMDRGLTLKLDSGWILIGPCVAVGWIWMALTGFERPCMAEPWMKLKGFEYI